MTASTYRRSAVRSHRTDQELFAGRKSDQLSGEIEVNETYIGGKARNMHASKRHKLNVRAGRAGENSGKFAVMGLLERHGEVRCHVIPDAKKKTLRGHIDANVEKGSTINSDEFNGYMGLTDEYVHNVINQAEKYVDGKGPEVLCTDSDCTHGVTMAAA